MKRWNKPVNLATGIFGFERTAIPVKHRLLAEVQRKWKDIVGEQNAKHSSPQSLRGHELLVHVDDPLWVSELQFHKAEILENIGKQFPRDAGEAGVSSVRFRTGPLAESAAEGRGRIRFVPDPEQRKKVEEALGEVKDPELKAALSAYLTRKIRVEEAPGPSKSPD